MSDKHKEQFAAELAERLANVVLASRMRLVGLDSAGRFDQDELTAVQGTVAFAGEVVAKLIDGWSVNKTMLDLDADGILRDPSAPLRNPGDDYDADKARKVVVYEISTRHRELTADEQAKLDADNARRSAEREQRNAVYRWELSDQTEPPPDGIDIGTLLQYTKWWVTKDKRAVRLVDMEPGHRVNLLRLMRRNAEAWKEAEFARFLMSGAPDEVQSSAEYLTGRDWLAEKPLFRALRHLVLADQVGAACLVEWFDDKSRGCLHGADGHVCVMEPGHEKRCTCRCGARPAKKSAAADKAFRERQQALIKSLFPTPEEVAEHNARTSPLRFMNLNAIECMGLGDGEQYWAARDDEQDDGPDSIESEDIH